MRRRRYLGAVALAAADHAPPPDHRDDRAEQSATVVYGGPARSGEYRDDEEVAVGRHVLVWDAPNVDMTLANIIDGKPTAKERPDLAILGDWLVDHAGPDDDVEACVFVNVAPHVTGPLRGWVLWLLEQGFRVFAKPKHGDSDVDDDMLDHLWARYHEGDLDAVYVGSNDAKAFVEPLTQLMDRGVAATVLGFAEYAGALTTVPGIRFVDLETVDGLFAEPLPRITLETLPDEGRWFEPTGRLGAGADGGVA